MELVGYMDSPFVRRVAVSAQFLGIDLAHREISIFRDFEAFQRLSPLVKVPTLICDDGRQLVDSTLIIEFLEARAGRSLYPADTSDYSRALHLVGVALVGMEKTVQNIYEVRQRPEAYRYEPWVERITTQLSGAMRLLETETRSTDPWFFGAEVTQADISTAVSWTFVQHVLPDVIDAASYPRLTAFTAAAERLDEFKACPVS